MSEQNSRSKIQSASPWHQRAAAMIQGIAVSSYRATIQYFKNFPSKIINYIRTKNNEKKRIPKRTRPNRIYVLVGYTTQAHIDRKFRKEKFAHIIRNVLIAGILVILVFLASRYLIPLIDSEQYKQMLGINDVGEMTRKDPFEADSSNKVMTFVSETTVTTETTIQSVDTELTNKETTM